MFPPTEDPGPDFVTLLAGRSPDAVRSADVLNERDVPHGTTVVAMTYDGGVVIAGDRRATAGNLISYRTMRKVFSADRHSGVAIAGAAGMAIEMVKLFQLQLEHYEKVEGRALSLEGKANQLSGMVRGNLPAAMQGMAVVPIFCGFDERREVGRLFEYDVTGGRYEESFYATSGSGSLHAGTVIKLGYRANQSEDDAVNLCISSLFQAADADSATGGPDPVRGIYPIIAAIDAEGYREVPEDDIAQRFDAMIGDLRSATAAPGEGGQS
jgi:proteasome beta subunit